MSGFVGWFEVMSKQEACLEVEIKQVRELCRDIIENINITEHWCGEKLITDKTKEMLEDLPGCLEFCRIRLSDIKDCAFGKHWRRKGDQ